MQQPVTVYYEVTGGGVNLTNQTAVIDRNKLNTVATIKIPAGIIVAPNTTATLTHIKALTAGGAQLTLGQKNTPATQKLLLILGNK